MKSLGNARFADAAHIVKAACFATIVALAVFFASSPAKASSSFDEAHSLRSLDIMLMVTALRCRTGPHDFQADYNRFAAAHLPRLNEAGHALRQSFAASHRGAHAERALDRLGVRIANSYGDGHPWMECAELRRVTQELALHSDPHRLAETARYLLSEQRPGAVQYAEVAPNSGASSAAQLAQAQSHTVREVRISYAMTADWEDARPLAR